MNEFNETRERKIDLYKANLWEIFLMFILIPIYGLPFMAIWHYGANWKQMAKSAIEFNDSSFLSGLVFIILIMMVTLLFTN